MVLFLLRLPDRKPSVLPLQERKVTVNIRRMNQQEVSMAGLYLMTWAMLNLDPDDSVWDAVQTVSDKMIEDAGLQDVDAAISRMLGGDQ